jgi:hypothetical protein
VRLLRRIICWAFGHRYVQVGGCDQERCDRCKRMTRDLPCVFGCGAMRHNYVCTPTPCEWHSCPQAAVTARTDLGGTTFTICREHERDGEAAGYWRTQPVG